MTISSSDGAYSSTCTVPASSGRIFKEVRAGNTDDLLVDITDPYGAVIPQKRIGLIVDSSDRITNLRAASGNNAVSVNYTHASGFNNVVAIRYPTNPGDMSYNSDNLPVSGDAVAGGTVVYIGSATGFTDSNLEMKKIYYYRVFPYKPHYIDDGQGGQVQNGYYWGNGVTASARTNLNGTLASDMSLIEEATHPYQLVGTVSVAMGTTLTINPGVTVYGEDRSSRLIIYGTLNANASSEFDRIFFTSDNTTPLAGDWGFIHFVEGSTGNLTFVTIEYAGDDNFSSNTSGPDTNYFGVYEAGAHHSGLVSASLLIDSSPILEHVIIREADDITQYYGSEITEAAGIWIRGSAAPDISNSVVDGVTNYGIYVASSSGNYSITNSLIKIIDMESELVVVANTSLRITQ